MPKVQALFVGLYCIQVCVLCIQLHVRLRTSIYTSTQVDKYTSIQIEVVTWTYVLLKVVSRQDTWYLLFQSYFLWHLYQKNMFHPATRRKLLQVVKTSSSLDQRWEFPQVLQSERFTQLVICKNFGHPCGLTPDDHFSESIWILEQSINYHPWKTNIKTHLKLGQKFCPIIVFQTIHFPFGANVLWVLGTRNITPGLRQLSPGALARFFFSVSGVNPRNIINQPNVSVG